MRPLQTISVETAVPAELERLRALGRNLRWSWHRPTLDLFREVDPEVWESTGGNPVTLLQNTPAQRLRELAGDPGFRARVDDAVADLERYRSGDRWFQESHPNGSGPVPAVAYFSMEFGISPTLPIYSGGLGILAGDHLKSASDLGLPLIGLGLLYQWGYFSQSLDRSGWQQENYRHNDPEKLAVEPVRDATGRRLTVAVRFPGDRELTIALWVAHVGRVPLLLLDTNVEENDPDLRGITDRLYGGDADHRIRQEIVLGIGGVRALDAFCAATGHPHPTVFHMNEGHAGFSGLERIGQLIGAGSEPETALAQVRAGGVFTTHTPVPAGIDRFDAAALRYYLDADEHGSSRLIPGLSVEAALALGTEADAPHIFNMAHMGLRLAQRANGVSQLHGTVSRAMFSTLYPGFDAAEVPITSVTNGVHRHTWTTREARALLDKAMPGQALGHLDRWEGMRSLPDQDIAATRDALRRALVEVARVRLRDSWLQRGADTAQLGWIDEALDPSILTIGFARRVSTYKRLTLMLSDPDRLRRILLDRDRPAQIVIAGKAHPADRPGKEFMQQMVRFADDIGVRHRIVFLPDYDITLGRRLTAGADVWLNNPVRPEEASGTSGMKAVLNGALTLSVSDGWWDELRSDGAGWTIPSVESEDRDRRDRLEADALYDILEHRVVPLFYDHDENGMSTGWNAMIRTSLAEIAPRVTATRMVRDYVEDLYLPAADAAARFAADPELAPAFTTWRERVVARWPHVRLRDVRALEADGHRVLTTGEELTVSAAVDLGGLADQDVEVQAVIGRLDADGGITAPSLVPMRPARDGRYTARLQVADPGSYGYTVRIVPAHPVLAHVAELGLVVQAS